ncbi:ankyrin repeat and BTB/POZ domain-containing protein 2 isoform X2 [Neocloeon triangulifer]|uniref:ankyrin repeat and BTB/POZ domain-containing protein 2 isoform X2 n=1 Tax=Neocloeon triangulifer TaxID=2078957 RepID=UPI00286F000F|nr:ankyrin repeat and BTB/POZ domain-containing protein 2 isoform X2 [Neocloeon triangulifer]
MVKKKGGASDDATDEFVLWAPNRGPSKPNRVRPMWATTGHRQRRLWTGMKHFNASFWTGDDRFSESHVITGSEWLSQQQHHAHSSVKCDLNNNDYRKQAKRSPSPPNTSKAISLADQPNEAKKDEVEPSIVGKEEKEEENKEQKRLMQTMTISRRVHEAFQFKLKDVYKRGVGDADENCIRPGDFARTVVPNNCEPPRLSLVPSPPGAPGAPGVPRGPVDPQAVPVLKTRVSPASRVETAGPQGPPAKYTPTRDLGGQNVVRGGASLSVARAMPQHSNGPSTPSPLATAPAPAALLRTVSKDRLASAQSGWTEYSATSTTTVAVLPQRPSPASNGVAVYKASSREVAPVPRQSPLRATPSRPTGTPPTLGKSTPPLTEWSPDSNSSSSTTTPGSAGLNKLELCQFYNVQQFPERDIPHEKQVLQPKQHNPPAVEKIIRAAENELEANESKGSPTIPESPEKSNPMSQQPHATAEDNSQCPGSRLKRPAAKMKSRRRNILSFPHHLSVDELRLLQRRQDSCGGSSSDENRSSGHASMSDGHTSSSPPADSLGRKHNHYKSPLGAVPEDERLSASVMLLQKEQASRPSNTHAASNSRKGAVIQQTSRSRHRATPAKLESGGGLEDIRLAIEQLTLRSHGSRASYSTSTYSSMSGSESEPVRRLIRHSSLETINTNGTAADEFVWVDSHNRLVELQHLPWTNHDVLRVIQQGRAKDHLERVSMETVPRLAYLLQRALVRIAREAQRLAKPLGMCSKHEVASALKIVLSPALADSCTKSCLRAAAMFAVSGDQLKQSKSARAGLQLSVGRFHRWMSDVRLGKFIHEYAAVYLAAGMENLLEEVILQCLPDDSSLLTAPIFEHAIATNGDLWGLLQPYAHLNAGRTATGALSMPRWPSAVSLSSTDEGASSCSLQSVTHGLGAGAGGKTLEQCLLTTCVGSAAELSELLARVSQHVTRSQGRAPPHWAASALHALFYFMRCSQLEHAEHAEGGGPVQELVYERPYAVLPPLTEWARAAAAHAEHRRAPAIDRDDVLQAARLLLPGVDCPVRLVCQEEVLCPKRPTGDEGACVRRFKTDLAFKMLSCGRTDLIPHALQLLPSAKINTVNEQGLTPLMAACVHGDEASVRLLLEAGADVDTESPGSRQGGATDETQHWTALTYAALQGHSGVARLLLERGANVEGGARLSEDRCTETPLQVAVAVGSQDMVTLLLSHGANPFLSTLIKDSLCYSGAAQRGCFSAISVAAAHGQRATMHHLLAHHPVAAPKEVLSLEEILAEGETGAATSERRNSNAAILNEETNLKFSKSQIKALQEAMYHSAENNHLELTLDLRHIGVPWTLHCWMLALSGAHELRLESVIDQLLQDFLQVWPDDYSEQFVDECLPLLFTIFRYSKEGTTLLLADIFSTCYGWENVKEIREQAMMSPGSARIDPQFVNNEELSDVRFRVEGRLFFAHKIVLVTASPRFKSMLSSKFCEGSPPVVQINDIRYNIFQMVMQYLYNGGVDSLEVDQTDVLELMAAANFFQLDGLLRFCEAQCASLVDLDNIVSMYIHAKVYGAGQLLEFCQGFLLQNMVALLTYDDSVKRLLFGKKLHNHDVLAGLLLTLQARIRGRSGRITKMIK